MDITKFSDLMNFYGQKQNIVFSEEQIQKFYRYMNLIIDWNEKINLTAITNPEDIILKHFIDSLTIEKYIHSSDKVIDVGTGAGFPGIPLKIYRTELKITLMDSLNKRIKFLNEIISELELKDIVTVHGRVEELGKNKKYREKFDIVTARAVAKLSILSEYLLPLSKVGGKCICMKGSEIKTESKEGLRAIDILGGELKEIEEFNLSNTDITRNIVIVNKIKSTPARFPRKPGTPSKEPIK